MCCCSGRRSCCRCRCPCCSCLWLPWGKAPPPTRTLSRAHLDRMAGGSETLYLRGLARSYRPPTGLAAASTDARALSVAWMPALAMLIVCCSIASWMATWGGWVGRWVGQGRNGQGEATSPPNPSSCRCIQSHTPPPKPGSHLVLDVHLVKLVDAADAVVRQHQRARLDPVLASLVVPHHAGSQPRSAAALAAGVDGTRKKGRHILEHLALGSGRVADDRDVDVAAQLDALQGGWVDGGCFSVDRAGACHVRHGAKG